MAATVAVVGGGISGLAAAHRLATRAPQLRVLLIEQAGMLGGKLRTVELAGGPVEAGAEAFLVSEPDGRPSAALELVGEVGLTGAVVHPAVGAAALAISGALRPLPAGTLMGVPEGTDLPGIAAVVPGLDRDEGRPLLGPDADAPIGRLVRSRFGDQVVDRLVDPLLGGVYAGRADDLSLATAVPSLAEAARREHTLAAAVRAARRPRAPGPGRSPGPGPGSGTGSGTGPGSGPIFATLLGGLGRLVGELAGQVRDAGGQIRLGLPVRALTRHGSGWRLVLGPTREPERVDAAAVVLAVPARPAARLLAEVDAVAAGLVGQLDYASVGLVTLVLPEIELPELSGFLVPESEGYAVKAATFFDRKWAHLRRPGQTLLRASVGRYGATGVLQRTDEDLIDLVLAELAKLVGRPLPAPLASRVDRWGGALPQYRPGHLDRAEAVRQRLPATLAVAGAAHTRVGIPACVRSGWAAADSIIEDLEGLQA